MSFTGVNMRRLVTLLLAALGIVSPMEMQAAQGASCVYLMPDHWHRTGYQNLLVSYWNWQNYDSTTGRWIDDYGYLKGWSNRDGAPYGVRPLTIIYQPNEQGKADAHYCRKYN